MFVFGTSHSFVIVHIAVLVIFYGYYQVEARLKQVISVPGWFNSVEEYVVRKLNERPTDSSRAIIPKDDSEKTGPRKTKKRKRVVSKILNSFLDGVTIENYKLKETKRRKKKRKNVRRFQKTMAEKNTDSNLSENTEKVKRKPMDIIVHIKMNE